MKNKLIFFIAGILILVFAFVSVNSQNFNGIELNKNSEIIVCENTAIPLPA